MTGFICQSISKCTEVYTQSCCQSRVHQTSSDDLKGQKKIGHFLIFTESQISFQLKSGQFAEQVSVQSTILPPKSRRKGKIQRPRMNERRRKAKPGVCPSASGTWQRGAASGRQSAAPGTTARRRASGPRGGAPDRRARRTFWVRSPATPTSTVSSAPPWPSPSHSPFKPQKPSGRGGNWEEWRRVGGGREERGGMVSGRGWRSEEGYL